MMKSCSLGRNQDAKIKYGAKENMSVFFTVCAKQPNKNEKNK